MRRDGNKWSILTIIFVVFVSIPLLTLFLKIIDGPGESWKHLVKNVLLGYTLNSVGLVLGSALFSLLLGVSSAWIVSRYHIPFKRYLEWMLILPLTIPSYITAYAYAGVFDYGGPLSSLLAFVGMEGTKLDIMNLPGLIFVLGISLYPYVYVASRAVFLYQSGRLMEASKLLGANERKTFIKVVLPMARPAIFGGLLLVVMEVLNDYGAAKYFGVNTLTTSIFRAWFSLEEPATAVFLSVILLALVFVFMLIERWLRGARSYAMASKSDIRLPQLHPGPSQGILLFLSAFLPVLLGFVIPVSQLIYWCFLTVDKTASISFFGIALQSLGIALLTAALTVFCVLLAVYLPKWNRLKMLKGSTSLAIMGYAIPGAVLAIGVMIPSLAFDRWLIRLGREIFDAKIGLVVNGTIMGLIYAYVIRFLAVGYKPFASSQLKLGSSISESSRLLGNGPVRTFLKIDLPLLKTGILSAFVLVFVDIMKELPLTLILKPYDVSTLAVKAYEYASDELIMEASLPSLGIIATGLVPIIFLNKLLLNEDQRQST